MTNEDYDVIQGALIDMKVAGEQMKHALKRWSFQFEKDLAELEKGMTDLSEALGHEARAREALARKAKITRWREEV